MKKLKNMVRDKRDSLESFIQEQLIGPGGCANKFGVYPSEDNGEETAYEVLNTTPGSIYSSAILFPEKEQKKNDNTSSDSERQAINSNEDEYIGDENMSDEDSDEHGDEIKDFINHEDDEDINSLSRRFPNKIGLSCCFKDIHSLLSHTKITISGRYYRKLTEKTRLYANIEDSESFEKIYSLDKCKELFDPYFVYKDGKLSLSRTITNSKNLTQLAQVQDRTAIFGVRYGP